jgi:protein tyrosine/serine phosphatase
MSRHIDFDAIENFRDFGGYPTVCGRGLVAGRLYRSGDHSRATAADLERLRALGVGAIVDLRQRTEREREPGRRWPGFAGEVIESDLTSDTPDWVEALKTSPMTPDWFYENTLGHYRLHAFEPRLIAVFGGLMRTLAEGEGAVVVHCAAGKDRTGAACALVHHLAGVPREAMIADFLLTNDESRIERKMAAGADFVARVTGRRPGDEAMRVSAQVYPAYLDAFFTSITARHGTVEAYLEAVLGVDAGLRERIRERLPG